MCCTPDAAFLCLFCPCFPTYAGQIHTDTDHAALKPTGFLCAHRIFLYRSLLIKTGYRRSDLGTSRRRRSNKRRQQKSLGKSKKLVSTSSTGTVKATKSRHSKPSSTSSREQKKEVSSVFFASSIDRLLTPLWSSMTAKKSIRSSSLRTSQSSHSRKKRRI